jgi:hypothetical protein
LQFSVAWSFPVKFLLIQCSSSEKQITPSLCFFGGQCKCLFFAVHFSLSSWLFSSLFLLQF